MKDTIKTWLQTALPNWLTLLYFEIFYKVIGITLLTMLADEGSLMSAAAVLLFFYYVYIEITAIIVYCEAGWRAERLSVWKLFKETFSHSFRLFHIKNFPILVLLLPVIALSAFPLTSGLLNKFQIPEFLLDFLQDRPILFIVFAAGMLGLNILLFFSLFRFPAVILHEEIFLGKPFQMPFLKGQEKRSRRLSAAQPADLCGCAGLCFYLHVPFVLVSE